MDRLKSKAEPGGASLFLAPLAHKIALIKQSRHPRINKPMIMLFSADHGFYLDHFAREEEPESPFERFFSGKLEGLAAVEQHDISCKAIDMGLQSSFENKIDFWIAQGNRVVNRKIGHGSRDFSEFPATTTAQAEKAVQTGYRFCRQEIEAGADLLLIGGLSLGAHYSAAALFHSLFDLDPDHFLIESEAVDLLCKAVKRNPKTHDPFTLLTFYGGLDISGMLGAIFAASHYRRAFIIDDLAGLAALTLAVRMKANIKDYALLSQRALDEGGALVNSRLELEVIAPQWQAVSQGLSSATDSILQCYEACQLLKD